VEIGALLLTGAMKWTRASASCANARIRDRPAGIYGEHQHLADL
jgi:hypothetical protein